MLAHDQFGIPVPLVESNPFRLTAHRALNGSISVPEGPFAGLDTLYFRPWFTNLQKYLEEALETPFPYSIDAKPVPRYVFHVSSYYLQLAQKLQLDDFEILHTAPSLNHMLQFLRNNPTQTKDWLEVTRFLQHYLPEQAFNEISLRYRLTQYCKQEK